MIDHLSNRINNITRRRNDTVHRLWFIGWGNEETETYEVASSIKSARDIGKKGQGGVKFTSKDTTDFEEIIAEFKSLNALLHRFQACILLPTLNPGVGRPANDFQPVNQFHYKQGALVEGPPNGRDPAE